jgi:hypothetical protein
MDFTFIKQAICEEKGARVYVNIMISGITPMEARPLPSNHATQEIWETLNGRGKKYEKHTPFEE